MIRLKAPARVCLFGEHQDYLNYPVISMAMSKYIYLEAERISQKIFIIELPDINETLEIQLNNKELEYDSKRDYLRSGYNQFLRKGVNFNKGYKIKITGDIPINAGAASSSAFVIAWLYFLNHISDDTIKEKSNLAIEGYNTEVKEFNEAGGMMDHYSSIYGNLIYLESKEANPYVIEMPYKLDGFVLGNSLEKKETVEDLRRVKSLSLKSFEALMEIMPSLDIFKSSLEEIKPYLPSLNMEHQEKIIGNIINRDITIKAKDMILKNPLATANSKEINNFYKQLGNLLNMHEEQLKNRIKITTEKIDNMVDASIEAGAYGAKINGSGFGGTMFALAPGKENQVKIALERSGGEAFIINTSNGVEIY